MKFSSLVFLAFFFTLSSCMREDTDAPIIILNADKTQDHFRTEPYIDPGVNVADNYSCNLMDGLTILNEVDINKYGTYTVTYVVEDEAGNSTTEIREVDIVLPLNDYYSQNYNAYDTCSSANYFYTGLVQDCDCDDTSVIVGNISNFGLSASFILPVSGQYNHQIILDTVKADVHFLGTGTMSIAADTIFWDYTIQDSVSTDVCRSVWIKE